LLALPFGIVFVRAVKARNLALGAFQLLVFSAPAALFQFFRSRYFPVAILLFALLLLWPWRDAPASISSEDADSGSAAGKLLA
jgi:hypothetical protein